MNISGALAKSSGDRASTNQTVIMDSSRPASNDNDKQRHSSATYKWPTEEACGNVDRNQFRTEAAYPQGQRVSPGAQPVESAASTFFHKYKEAQLQKAPQKNARQPVGQTIEQPGYPGTKKNVNSRLFQTQANKSACTTARGPGPIVASGPLNPIGQKSPATNYVQSDPNQRSNTAYMRTSQLR